jgi:hypothetical protein
VLASGETASIPSTIAFSSAVFADSGELYGTYSEGRAGHPKAGVEIARTISIRAYGMQSTPR